MSLRAKSREMPRATSRAEDALPVGESDSVVDILPIVGTDQELSTGGCRHCVLVGEVLLLPTMWSEYALVSKRCLC